MKSKNQKLKQNRHIALYLAGLRQGGAERVMTTLADDLYEKGWKVTLVTTFFTPPEYYPVHAAWDPETGTDDPEKEGIHRYYSEPVKDQLTGSRVRNFMTRWKTLRGIWKDTKPDLILAFISMNNIMAILTSRGLSIPVVVSVRGTPAMEYNTFKLKTLADLTYPMARGIVLQTRQAKEFFKAAVRKKSVILPNPLNPDFIRPLTEGERKKQIVSIGRLDDNKDQQLLLHAFAGLKSGVTGSGKNTSNGKARVTEGWSIHLYGDGPDRSKLETEAEKLGIRDQVIFEGIVPDIADRIADSSVFVLTSRTEGMPNALIESMALGLACISTDCPCGGPAELIREGENGMLIPVGDEKELGRKLELVMTDQDLAERMGREAAKAQELFRREAVSRKWEEYLLSCLL